MNTIHNNGENDKTLKDGLEKLGRAYQALPDEEPPELLDQAILNSAHRAVEKKPHWMKFGWLHGLTTAAVVVLALSIIINQRDQVPDFDDVIKVNESAGLVREKAGKRQPDVKDINELRIETKEEDSGRQDLPSMAPVPAVAENETMAVAVGKQAPEPESRARRSMSVQDSQSVKSDRIDSDAAIREMVVEEPAMDEVDLSGDVSELQLMSKRSQPAAVAAMAPEDAESLSETDAEIEKLLLSIIKLKQSGDEAWITQLNSFKQTHPDYPLPDELSD